LSAGTPWHFSSVSGLQQNLERLAGQLRRQHHLSRLLILIEEVIALPFFGIVQISLRVAPTVLDIGLIVSIRMQKVLL
jgi:hypothetical protein